MMKRKLLCIILALSLITAMPLFASYAQSGVTTSVTTDDGNTEETAEATEEPEEEEEESETPEPTEKVLEDEESGEDDGKTHGVADVTGAAGGLGFDSSIFPGCRGHWAEEIIRECMQKEYLSGYDDGTFRPDAYVTPAELLHMLKE